MRSFESRVDVLPCHSGRQHADKDAGRQAPASSCIASAPGAAKNPARRSQANIRPQAADTGGPDTIRTCDLPLRRGTLYPAELRGHAKILAQNHPWCRLRPSSIPHARGGYAIRIDAPQEHSTLTDRAAGRRANSGSGSNAIRPGTGGRLSQEIADVAPRGTARAGFRRVMLPDSGDKA